MVSHPAPMVRCARTPGALPAAASFAVLIAALGWLLMQGADWGLRHVGAALSGYMVLAAGVALAAAWHLRGMGFGVAFMGATIVSWAQEGRPAVTPALYRCGHRRW